jgi:short-subunit dehydrogenase
MQIRDKVVLITGASRGIGLACAQELNKRGAKVILANRGPDSELKSHFKHPENVELVTLDLSSGESIDSLAQKILQEGRLDILFNNAGQLTGGLLEEQPVDDILNMYQVNLVGTVHLTRLLLPALLKRPEGKVIFNASVSGVMSLPCASTYASSKNALVALARSLQIELKKTNVSTLTLITPGIKTRMFDKIPKLYGDYMDVSNLSSISPEKYALLVAKAIEDDKLEYWPKGSVAVALFLSQHFQTLFRFLASLSFKRNS